MSYFKINKKQQRQHNTQTHTQTQTHRHTHTHTHTHTNYPPQTTLNINQAEEDKSLLNPPHLFRSTAKCFAKPMQLYCYFTIIKIYGEYIKAEKCF